MRKIDYTIAIVIALVFGGIGIHRFYVKDNVLGFFYLLFFWTLIPSLLSIIDIAVWLWNGEESFCKKYCKEPGDTEWVSGYWRKG